MNQVLPKEHGKTKFVGMINYGEVDISAIPPYQQRGIDGIRIAFHKQDGKQALEYSRMIAKRGYEIYIQPMVSLNYTDREFLDMIQAVNDIRPTALYIVDSFGAMKKDDLLHLFYMADHNLADTIMLGFHSHNNLQLSYSHAQALANHQTGRTVIIDSCVMGMGRGAGNLNTELFADYLNKLKGKTYHIPALLQIMDDVISPIYQTKYWGYSLPYYLSATHNCHPNYASYLDNKSTLTYENIHEIFQMMLPEKKVIFDKDYIRDLYRKYQGTGSVTSNYSDLEARISGQKVLIIAPGRSLSTEQEKIKGWISKEKPMVISVNFIPKDIPVNFVFVSNIRRWEDMDNNYPEKVILTSNIRTNRSVGFIVNYIDLLNTQDKVKDNAALMLIALLIRLNCMSIALAGLDGYSTGSKSNFIKDSMEFRKTSGVMEAINDGLTKMLEKFQTRIDIQFVTTPKYVVPRLGAKNN